MSDFKTALIEFYKNVLATVRYYPDSTGVVSKTIAGDSTKLPVAVSGKSLVIPTKEQLEQPDWSNRICFHPMREDFTSGQSPIFEDYRRAVNNTLQVHVGYIFLSIADMAVKDKEFQKNLPREAADYLRVVKDGDITFRKVLLDILSADPSKHRLEMEFIRINIQKSRKVDGQVRKRVANVVFPILEKLLTHSKENKVTDIAGVHLRGVDRNMLVGLYKLVFPQCDVPNAYDTYSDSLQAPSMDALLRCLAVLIERINETAIPMIGQIPAMEEMIIPYNWRDVALHIDENVNIFNSVPMLEGNVSTGHVVKNAAAIQAITVPSTQEAAQYAQAAVKDPNRQVTVAPVVQIDTGVIPTPTQQPMYQQPINNFVQPTQGTQTAPTSFKLDGPRTNTAPIANPNQGQQTQRVEAPQVQKHNISTPKQISENSQPLFAPQQQQPTQLPGMPQGTPTPVNTVGGIVYMYPDGTTYTQQQLMQMAMQAQIAQARSQQQAAQQLAATPAMQELTAINPMLGMMGMPGMMPGMPGMMPGMMMPGMMSQQNMGRAPGTPYVPIGTVQPVQQPGMMPGMMPNSVIPGMIPGMVPGMVMPGVVPGMMPGMPGMPGMMMPGNGIPGF